MAALAGGGEASAEEDPAFFAVGGMFPLLSRAFMLPRTLWGDDYCADDFLREHDRIARWFSGEGTATSEDRLAALAQLLQGGRGRDAAQAQVLEVGAGSVGVWTNVVRLAAARRGVSGVRYFCSDLAAPRQCEDLVAAAFAPASSRGASLRCRLVQGLGAGAVPSTPPPAPPLAAIAVDHAALSQKGSVGNLSGLAAHWPQLRCPIPLAAYSFDLVVGSHLFCVCQDRTCEDRTCGGVPQTPEGVRGFLEAVLHLMRPGGTCVLLHMAQQVPDDLRSEVRRWAANTEEVVGFQEIEPHFKDRFAMGEEFNLIRSNGTVHLREKFVQMVMLRADPHAYIFRRRRQDTAAP